MRKKSIKALFFAFIFFLLCVNGKSQVSSTFELRYFTSDSSANGETDFKGETEWFNTDERIFFLNEYADFASRYFDNPALDQKIVTDEEVKCLLGKIKSQPVTKIRKTVWLNGWKTYGYKDSQHLQKERELECWSNFPRVRIENGKLKLINTTIERTFDPLTWRFKLEINIILEEKSQFALKLKENDKSVISLILNREDLKKDGSNLIIEGDIIEKRFNCYLDDKLIRDFTLMADTSANTITTFSVSTSGTSYLDDLFLFNHVPQDDLNYPYYSSVIIDENFEVKTTVEGWQSFDFDDSNWKDADLPAVHGGLREKEEYFYLRKRESVGDFKRAFLQIETLDPGGEVWVNNEVVAVISNRHPHEIEITKHLKKNQENLIAIRVNPYKLNSPMPHSPTDYYIGWFLGRTKLVLTPKCRIKSLVATTSELGEDALQTHKITLEHPSRNIFEGSIEFNYYPWFPVEGEKVVSAIHEIKVRPRIDHEFQFDVVVPSPHLWSPESPYLYRVEAILKDKEGLLIDDHVITTGIRTIEQKNGGLYINGKREMLNGAQIMGFRTPIETISKNNRSAPIETVAEEMLMIKKMDANLLRVHVHAEKDTVDGINDPRYAEFADQMGVYLIWSTAAFIREGEAWNIDFKGYPKFVNQVINHPSIVLWEASNHPNRFKEHDISETHDYIKKIYKVISDVDQSRLISPTSFWQHTHYANYEGSIDYEGNAIEAVPEYMAPLNTRGSQDAYTGYGADWSKLRNAPNEWATSCLAANDKAYFNFEHEESIGQPNWELSKGKPWYLINSYEWDYDKGSIGRLLRFDEWRASQAWQAFSAWESMKKQMLLGYDGFSWCCLRGGQTWGHIRNR